MKITIKSVVTILLTIVFCLLSLAGKITSEQYMTVFTTVIAFYFGTQFSKNGRVWNVEFNNSRCPILNRHVYRELFRLQADRIQSTTARKTSGRTQQFCKAVASGRRANKSN